ncbi:MAG: TetR/AcrR family transcriptional regulator [Planctomycetota bacterium]
MSGEKETDDDQRTLKTRQALLDSLKGLVNQRRYEDFAVGDIIDQAEVGRSTFYDHYRGKDDMLVETMGHMLDVMAGVASEHGDVERLEAVLRHFHDNRKFAKDFFGKSPGLPVMARITRELARRIESELEQRRSRGGAEPSVPAAWIAQQLAEAQFAWIRAWLADDAACTPAELAKAMRSSALGSISGLC